MNDKKRYKAHVIYKNSEGKRVPGVTTITGELGWNTRVLIYWANNLGLEGIDSNKYVDDKAAIGTLAHLMITNSLQGIKTDLDDFTKNQITAAKNSVKSFGAWAKEHKINPILIEEPMVSDKYNFGGTMDIYADVDGTLELVDLKTGKGIYDEHLVQVGGGYKIILEEKKHPVGRVRILNIPRADSEKFEEYIIRGTETCEKIFMNCLENYKLHKTMREV